MIVPADPDDPKFMQLALDACRKGVESGQSPFGACLVENGKVLAATHNHVWLQTDPTAHAEVCCLRQAAQANNRIHFPGATIYSTTEPCPMCFCAIHWARVRRIVFAARIEDAKRFGFNELDIPNRKLKELGGTSVELVPDFMRDDAIAVFEEWKRRGGRAY